MRFGGGIMTESSVRIKLGVELDKSEFGQQLLELQQELDNYKLRVGIQREISQEQNPQNTSADPGTSSQDATGNDNSSVDLGVLSDMVKTQFDKANALISEINNHFYQCIEEVKVIASAFKSLSLSSNSDRQPEKGANTGKNTSTDTVLGDVIRETSGKIVTGLEKTWNRVGLLLSKTPPESPLPTINTEGTFENQSQSIFLSSQGK